MLGRDILCKLKAKIYCSADGLLVEFPEIWQMSMTTEKLMESTNTLPTVYWLRYMEDHLVKNFNNWKLWIQHMRPDLAMVTDNVQCTLFYDLTNSNETYAENWADLMECEMLNIGTGCYIIGPQGLAVEAKLNPSMKQWYRVTDAVPHVLLMILSEYEARNLGPMMNIAEQIEWIAKPNPKIFISRDKTYMKYKHVQ